ncbi:dicarboxylate/amino acid:cation symporter [Phenylobacterium sp.]|jgi:Na+/H+-dicarboxylate symporter|uniref:dicarboxylate/amino acid:cation symporter n=1 Tax=Phenylobacterium sp. TaxID=1871053 RepID=UPI002E329190|nr:dicarboxylate/amino acid:cation symporter [Phenylobacterium sp.]HEX2561687.1 dicarboxylate/amino acid:cation symporter [Phenylobacterium sp.]
MATPTDETAAPPARSVLQRYWFDVVLWKRIFGALVLGAIAGALLGEAAESIKWVGDLFIRLIRMVVVPLVFVSIVAGVTGMGDPRRLGSIGGKTLFLYLCTTVVAVIVGQSLGALIGVGRGVVFEGVKPHVLAEPPTVAEQLMGIVPLNPVEALANGDILAVIFFAIMVGVAILAIGEKGDPLRKVFDAGVEVMLFIVRVVMEVAPFGVFALIAWVAGTQGVSVFVHVFYLAVALVLGCLLQVLVVHGGLIRLVARLPAWPFFRDIWDAVLVAFSTSSSAATLPVSMRVAEKNLGVSHTVASTALPIGTTVSMDGTALYIGLLTMFAVQAFGVDLTFTQYLLAGLTTVLVAVGTAPIPSASLFMLAAVLSSIGISAEQTALVVGFVLPFDRLLDMTRTVANNTSDLAVAVTVAKWEDELDLEAYRARPVE